MSTNMTSPIMNHTIRKGIPSFTAMFVEAVKQAADNPKQLPRAASLALQDIKAYSLLFPSAWSNFTSYVKELVNELYGLEFEYKRGQGSLYKQLLRFLQENYESIRKRKYIEPIDEDELAAEVAQIIIIAALATLRSIGVHV